MSEKKKQTAAELKDEELKKVAGGKQEEQQNNPKIDPFLKPDNEPVSRVSHIRVFPDPTNGPT